MAKRVFSIGGQTYAGTAQGVAATAWSALKGGAATQIVDCLEFMINGMASASTAGAFMAAYSSTLGTVTANAAPGADGPMVVNATAIANPVIPYWAGTGPVPSVSATLPKLSLGLNVFGGIIRWNAAPTQQWTMIGNVANGGETVVWNSTTHGGNPTGVAANMHIIYEPY